MKISIGLARLGFFVAALAVMLAGTALLSSTTAHAQNPPATYYGKATAGDVITANIGDTVCGTATADAAGEWVISIADGGCGGAAVAGATVTMTLNGATADQTATWAAGGTPADLVNGIALTVTVVAEPVVEEAAEEPAAEEAAPAAPDTGNAGFAFGESGTSSWLALSLGLFALAGVAGSRLATRRMRDRKSVV